MKVAKTISIDPEVARRAAEQAWARRQSFSAYVEESLEFKLGADRTEHLVRPHIREDIQPEETFKANVQASDAAIREVGGIGMSRPAPKPGTKK